MRSFNQSQPQINLSNNMQQTDIVNQSSSVYYPPTTQQPQQHKIEPKKRDKKVLKIYNDDGTEFNLTDEVAKDNAIKNSSNNEVLIS